MRMGAQVKVEYRDESGVSVAEGKIIGRTFEQNPRFDVLLPDGSVVLAKDILSMGAACDA